MIALEEYGREYPKLIYDVIDFFSEWERIDEHTVRAKTVMDFIDISSSITQNYLVT